MWLTEMTTQVFPSAHRGTGNGVSIGLNRIMGIISAVVGKAANVSFIFHYTFFTRPSPTLTDNRQARPFQSSFAPPFTS